jgi:phosphatidylserine decarboxylase
MRKQKVRKYKALGIPITPYAVREVLLFGGPLLVATVVLAFVFPWAAPVTGLLLIWVLSFFRDPERRIPDGPGLLVSPADGKVVDIATVETSEYLTEPALRIGIFLNVFNVHVNRAPCDGTVEYLKYTPGAFHHANAPTSPDENERQSVGLRTAAGPMMVRQISGAVARRIVCPLEEGAVLERGERYGMIKFGSRTELWVPASVGLDVRVKIGDRVKGGLTVLAALTEEGGGS